MLKCPLAISRAANDLLSLLTFNLPMAPELVEECVLDGRTLLHRCGNHYRYHEGIITDSVRMVESANSRR